MAGPKGKSATSFATEQLGIPKGELPAPVLQPPSNYPPLEYKPLSLTLTTELSYLVELKRDFSEYMLESTNNVSFVTLKKEIERYSDRYQDTTIGKLDKFMCDWDKMPADLKLSRKRKSSRKIGDVAAKRRKIEDIDDIAKLDELERRENAEPNDEEVEENEEEEDKDKEEEEYAEEEIEEDDRVDHEMDDGTDYVNIHADSEGNDDDDDNGEETPAVF